MPIDDQTLLQDAPLLKADLAKWLLDEDYCRKAQEVADHLQNKQTYSASLFSDSPNYPLYSLVAYAQKIISLAQFTSIVLQWSAYQDYTDDYAKADHYYLPEKKACAEFRRFLRLSSPVFFNNNKINDAQFKKILRRLSNKKIPNSERQFSVINIENSKNLASIFFALKGIGFELFMPIIDSEKGVAQLIIPSFSMILAVCEVLSPDCVQLIPRIGYTPTPDVGLMHESNQHPFGISFPGYIHQKVDRHQSKCFGFPIHDIYHIVILSCIPIKKAFIELNRVASDYIAEKNIASDVGANFIFDFLIDAEYSQYFHQINLHKKYDQLDDETLFIRGLLRLLFPADLTYFSEHINQNISLSSPTEKQLDLFGHLVKTMLENSEEWLGKFKIDVPKVMGIILSGDDIIKPTMSFFNKLQEQIDSVLNHYRTFYAAGYDPRVDSAISFLEKQRNNICELKRLMVSSFEIMQGIIRSQKIHVQNVETERLLPKTAIHQNLAIIREAQFAGMTCFYNALSGLLSIISLQQNINDNTNISSNLYPSTKSAISLFSNISVEMESLFAPIESLLISEGVTKRGDKYTSLANIVNSKANQTGRNTTWEVL